ncbi:NAD(P)/FAD-dependent oxidoreductase [Marinobacterium jannaschii]|uniref:NAD(P)/FAD-dependent oxidoreductase n=1 Tax=Marinobacterium jannaschii TaxID=64970 RepID=UPI0009FE79DF|nr:NAD(P)/FAD-dependent oxidoreductase [Marinobacterium jannaschii]
MANHSVKPDNFYHAATEAAVKSYDIAIIGAGPAGMSAAITASKAGASVVVLDDKALPGGQIYRNVTQSPLRDPALLGPDYLKGQTLVEAYQQCSAEKLQQASVWHLGDNGEVLFSREQTTHSLHAREIILSCGAMERPFPIPGWHLPGVMSAGSAQVMLKSDALVCDQPVFVGSGPLLYLIVAQYLRLGIKVKALIDTTPKQNYLQAATEITGALSAPGMIGKGISLLNEIRQAGVAHYRYARELRIEGENQAEAISFSSGGQSHRIDAGHIFLHQGVIPNLNISRAAGVDHHWCPQQLCWKPTLNHWGQSSVDNIAVAGDGSGIVGADGAALMGRLAALQQLARLNLIPRGQLQQQAAADQRQLDRLNRFRRFIDRLYRPLDAHRIPDEPDTVVCRCEERTVAQLQAGFAQGGNGPQELKGLTRCGMGPCQGRQCGHTVSELLAKWRGEPVDKVGYYRLRSPMRLLNLTELSHFTRLEPATHPAADKGDKA